MIIVIVLLIHWANSRFDHQVSVELEKLFAPQPAAWVESSAAVVLPAPVQRWLDRSGATDQPGYRKVKLVQEFQLRLKPEQKTWYRGEATQYFNTVRPGFIWTLSLDILPLVKIRGRDLLLDGKGEMLIKLWSLFALVSEKNNPKIDEGTLQRFLGEMVWFPWMATSPYIEWEAGTDETAKAILSYKGHAVSGTFEFDKEGKFRKFRTDRYLGGNEHAKRHPWVITAEKHGVHQNIEIPTHCKASWILDDGHWNWAIISVSSARYDH